MKDTKGTSFIIAGGLIVLVIFMIVIALNLIPNYESNSYFVKVDEEMSAKIESINILKGKLVITTSGNALEYCVKSTRTAPLDDALCWKKVQDNKASISVFEHKKYYVWIKDEEGHISNYMSVNSNEKSK